MSASEAVELANNALGVIQEIENRASEKLANRAAMLRAP